MKLSTRGRYAVTAMLDLSCYGTDKPIALADISHRQEISLSYLEQLFAKLRKRGLVQSVRGPGGGYLLGCLPEFISVADIIRAVDEPIQATACEPGSDQGCQKTSRCITHALWENLNTHLNQYLESISLGGLLANHQTSEQASLETESRFGVP